MGVGEKSPHFSSLSIWVNGGGLRGAVGCGQFHSGQLEFEVLA